MSIFGPTISWDPREPLPRELQRQKGNLAARKYDASSRKRGITGNAPFQVMSYVQARPKDLAAKQDKLPDLTTEEEGQNLLAPWSVDIDASIVQDTASVQVTQVFWNNSTVLIPQGTYTFPLPTGCSVTEFTCQVGSRVLKGTVKPKKEAQEAFNDHVAAGRMAGLLNQDTTEIFSATLGNIPPDTRVTVKISYITLLKYHLVSDEENKETSTFTIPTCIASRYGPQPKFAGTTTTVLKQGLTLNIKVLDSRVMHAIRSSTHKIKVEEQAQVRAANSWADLADQNPGKALSGQASVVELDQGLMFLDKDFALEIVVDGGKGKAAPQVWIEHHPVDPNQAALMAILPPGLLNQIPKPPARQREILFLVDQSGSMGDKINSLKSAMHFFLKGIPLGNKFNIARFGSTFTSWCPQSVQYSGESLEAALAYVSSSIDANMGGTEILGAVKSILGSRDTRMLTDIIILTDGQVWRLDELLATVKDARKASGNRIRFFCLGIGERVSHALVEGVASIGGGYAEVVPASEQNSWESKLLSMEAASVENDPIEEVKIYLETYEGKAIHCPTSAMSPSELQNLNPFIRNRVYMLLESEMTKDFRSLVLAITLPDGTQPEQRFPLQILHGRDTTIHKLAARSLLHDFEHGRSSCNMRSNSLHDGQAEALACKWSLASKWTSFFLGEETKTLEDDLLGSLVVISGSRKIPDLLGQGHMGGPRFATKLSYGRLGTQKGVGTPMGVGPSMACMSQVQHYMCAPGAYMEFVWPDLSPTNITSPSDRNQRFFKLLLGHQRFDGSFEFATDEDFVRLLGQDTFDAVASLVDHTLSRSLYFTIAVTLILEQHFASEKQFWHMMHSKASTHIKDAHDRVTNHEMEVFRDKLRRVRSPLHQVGMQLEQLNGKRGTQNMPSECADQASTRLRETPLGDQAVKDHQNIHGEVIAPGGDRPEDPPRADPVTRQPRRVIEIAPLD